MKYMGSKARVAKEISAILNEELKQNPDYYIEPFVGGANLIDHILYDKKVAMDSNKYLIGMWKALLNGWNPPENITKAEYECIRDNKDKYPDEIVAFAGFVATYNAKWFGGYAGIVQTKEGTTRNYYDEARRNILKQVPKLEGVYFINRKYQEFNLAKLKNCVIYCDPPYMNSTQYKDEFCHTEFWEWVRIVSKTNKVYVSEYNAPDDFICIWQKELTTTLDKSSRKVDIEKLFVFKECLN
jgi:DNA adenine methylase